MAPLVKSLLIVVALLLPPIQAWAECAWVLWQEHRRVGTSWQERPFFFEQAYTTREECEGRVRAANAIAQGDNEIKNAGRIPDDGIRRFYQCIPDTVDPRGPRGGSQ